ncbi:MAG: electron transfer flavoprotein subunit beta/FixA family protein [Anaerolineales bacterium]|nr:electron transfer flavoprotein subunit beta/FixA family protein [Anaerolineales bacterium]
MHIVVCAKQTPSTTAILAVDDGKVTWSDPGGSPDIANPWDEYAIEEAISLKEKHGGKVTVLSMGPEDAKEALKTAIAMGCDEAVLITDDSLKGSDTLATSYVLAKAIEKLGDVDLVIFGRQAIDGDTGQTSMQVARQLGWTPLSFVAAVDDVNPDGKTITVTRAIEAGRQKVKGALPAALSVLKEINEPRYPSFKGIRQATKYMKSSLPIWSISDLELEPGQVGQAGAKVKWPQVTALPPKEVECTIIEADSPEQAATMLVDKLFEEKVL